MRVLLAGGGSAGHTSPLLATADALQRLHPGVEITCLGTRERIEAQIIPAAGYPLEFVPSVPLPRRPNADLARLPGRLRAARSAALEVVDRIRPDVIAGFGGFVSVPAYLAARTHKVPLVVHEGNTLPGVANKLGARITDHVATSFPDTRLRHATYLGLPIRRMIATLDRAAHRVQALHVTGPAHEATPPDTGVPYVVVGYVDRMDLAYSAADAVLCRSGSNTVTEVSGVGLPAIFVPLPIGNGEQALNARAVIEAGGGLLVDDAALTPDWIANHAVPLLTDPARLQAMGAAAAHLIPLDADEKLARMIL